MKSGNFVWLYWCLTRIGLCAETKKRFEESWFLLPQKPLKSESHKLAEAQTR